MNPREPLGEILRNLRAEPSRTWSVIITVFGDAIVPRGGSVWLGTLVRFFAALGSNDGVVRTAMSRLAADGWLERSRVGRNSFYHLTEKGRVPFRQATEHIYGARARDWNGHFEMLLIGNARERESVRSLLLTAGFGAAAPGVWVAPAGAPVPRLGAGVLQLEAGCDLVTARKLAKACWPLERTAAAYARFLNLFTPLQAALDGAMPIAEIDAFVARVLLIHEYRRIVLRDPKLPLELLPKAWPGVAARELCARLYHRLLPASERWLDRHGQSAAGKLPPAGPELARRFRADAAPE
ncbi:MAG: phenylacetic acid degradation operon negative regulatory protein PaaX [Hyphomicrobiaceae bacterium]|nr:phenylacetic acid degradation operon negative regulatory protein PaaX [Hyphomicrobiaceae bacterium]